VPHQILSAPPRLGLVSAALNPPCSVTLHGCPWLPKPMCTRRFRVVCMGCNLRGPSTTHADQVLAEAYPITPFGKPEVRGGLLLN
jgi:hypothetical protein